MSNEQERRALTPAELPPGVHATAVIAAGAKLAEGVAVGPYAVVGPHVQLGRGTRVGPHAVLEGHTEIGEETQVFAFACIGSAPQSRSYRGEPTRLVVGARCTIREFVTVNRGTVAGGGVTAVGDDCMIMAYSHVAHDCVLGKDVVLANDCGLAGHVSIGDGAVLGGKCGVQQFARIGRLAFVAGASMVVRDVPPFVRVAGDRARLEGLNRVGLKRAGVANDVVADLRTVYRHLFRSDLLLAEAMASLPPEVQSRQEICELVAFIRESATGICGTR